MTRIPQRVGYTPKVLTEAVRYTRFILDNKIYLNPVQHSRYFILICKTFVVLGGILLRFIVASYFAG